MFHHSNKRSLYIALFIGFIDYLGIGLVYPLFSSMIFDIKCPLLHPDTSHTIRGMWLGILFSLMPLAQFLTAPIWGAISDSRGRKKTLQISLLVALGGYLVAFFGVLLNSLSLLLSSRLLIGCASGNTAIVQAVIADVSKEEEKTKNFGLYSMASGMGFTLGPFCSGMLSSFHYSIPFISTTVLIVINLIFTFFFFKETHFQLFKRALSWNMGLIEMKKAFFYKGLRTLFLCSFLNYFGWSYFFEFIPVFLIFQFDFTTADLGIFFGLAGAFYALSAGLLIRPFIKRFKPETLFFCGLILTALSIFLIPLNHSIHYLWPILFLICYSTSLTTPTSTALVSNSSKMQGETLGIFSSVNAAALIISPIASGAIVGNYPTMPMWIGGTSMLLGASIYILTSSKKIFSR